MESENSGMISFRELVEQQCDEEWMNRERTFITESHWSRTERIEIVWWVEKGCVALCISLLKRKHEWRCTAFYMQTGRECAKKKKKKKGERNGRNCRGLWCMKQCRIWKRLGDCIREEKKEVGWKKWIWSVWVLKWFRNMNNTIKNIKTTKDFGWE